MKRGSKVSFCIGTYLHILSCTNKPELSVWPDQSFHYVFNDSRAQWQYLWEFATSLQGLWRSLLGDVTNHLPQNTACLRTPQTPFLFWVEVSLGNHGAPSVHRTDAYLFSLDKPAAYHVEFKWKTSLEVQVPTKLYQCNNELILWPPFKPFLCDFCLSCTGTDIRVNGDNSENSGRGWIMFCCNLTPRNSVLLYISEISYKTIHKLNYSAKMHKLECRFRSNSKCNYSDKTDRSFITFITFITFKTL